MNLSRKFHRLLGLFSSEKERDYVGFILSEKISKIICPGLVFSEHGRIWMQDADFFDYYREFEAKNFHSADRKFFLNSLLSLVEHLEGHTVECGVYQGASSWLICQRFRNNPQKMHYAFDSFEGLSQPIRSRWRVLV